MCPSAEMHVVRLGPSESQEVMGASVYLSKDFGSGRILSSGAAQSDLGFRRLPWLLESGLVGVSIPERGET